MGKMGYLVKWIEWFGMCCVNMARLFFLPEIRTYNPKGEERFRYQTYRRS